MKQRVLDVKDRRLREKSQPVIKVDKKIKSIIKDIKDTLATQNDPEGVGLAAPQIGKNLCIFLINYEKISRIIINPKVLYKSKSKSHSTKASRGGKEILEGCLSLPHYYGPLQRAKAIKIEYLTEAGEKKVEEFKGFLAQIIQHEIDHLDGILFIDRILEQKKPLYKFEGGEWEEVELV